MYVCVYTYKPVKCLILYVKFITHNTHNTRKAHGRTNQFVSDKPNYARLFFFSNFNIYGITAVNTKRANKTVILFKNEEEENVKRKTKLEELKFK